MLTGKMVRIRLKREFAGQPTWVFFGKVMRFSENWLAVEGKGILVFRRQAVSRGETVVKGQTIIKGQMAAGETIPAEIDEDPRLVMVPRESICNVRVLPDTFDLNNIRVVVTGRRIDVVVDGAPNTAIDEITEG